MEGSGSGEEGFDPGGITKEEDAAWLVADVFEVVPDVARGVNDVTFFRANCLFTEKYLELAVYDEKKLIFAGADRLQVRQTDG